MFHNEALQALDVLVAAAVEQPPLASPPTTPVIGHCYIVASSPTGEWTGHAGQLAGYTSGGWRFIAPFEGLSAHVRSSGSTAVYRSSSWEIGTVSGSQVKLDGLKVVGVQAAAIGNPAGGTTADVEARSAIDQILITMRQHGLSPPEESGDTSITWQQGQEKVEAFGQQLAPRATLRRNRRSHNVFGQFKFRTHVKGDNYAQAGHWHGARINRLGYAGCRSRRRGVRGHRGRHHDPRGPGPRLRR